ncbi:tetratricopeptide repeat protein [Kaarinaea lacus]
MKNRSSSSAWRCQLSFIIISVIFVVFIVTGTGCSSSSDEDTAGDNPASQTYQQGLSAYRSGDYSTAIENFEIVLSQYSSSIYADNSQYYIGRCYHELQQFSDARRHYDLLISRYPNSNWVDNAEYNKARSHFDEADTFTDPRTQMTSLTEAVNQLLVFVNNVNYANSSVLDAVRYYLGRSYHDQATLVMADAGLSTIAADQLFADARLYYDSVTVTSAYADNALYFKGGSYHDQGDYDNARATYTLLIDAATSGWADDAKYQFAKTYYDDGRNQTQAATAYPLFDLAIQQFNEFIDSTNPMYLSSNRRDSAYYFRGRSNHRQADAIIVDNNLAVNLDVDVDIQAKHSAARADYETLYTLLSSSSWADNALYQYGITFYDFALHEQNKNQPDSAVIQQNFSDAIDAFTSLLNNATFQNANSADNAQYYLARSYQHVAATPASERIAVFSAVNYDTARQEFDALIKNFAQSNWVDNAYYEIGNTYYEEAGLDPLTAVNHYNNALYNYLQVLSLFAGNSIREDNAAYQMALVYHNTGYCAQEQAAFNYLFSSIDAANISTTITDDYNNNHSDDLTAALATVPPTPSGDHSCDSTAFPDITANF